MKLLVKLLAVIAMASTIGWIAGLFLLNLAVVLVSFATLTLAAWLVDVVALATTSVEGEAARDRRVRASLAAGESVALVGCAVASWGIATDWHLGVTAPQQLLFGALWVGSSLAVAILFRAVRRSVRVQEPVEPPPPTRVAAQAQPAADEFMERFWSDRRLRRRWRALRACLYGSPVLPIGLAVLAGGNDGRVALGIALGGFALCFAGVLLLHRWLQIPLLDAAPPRPPLTPEQVPARVVFRPWLNLADTLPIALAVPAVVTAISGAFVASACLAGGAVTGFSRTRRMKIAVSPDDVLIVNFWKTVRFPWDRVGSIAGWVSGTSSAVSIIGAVLGADAAPLEGLRFFLRDPPAQVRVTVTLGADPVRNQRFQAAFFAICREARARAIDPFQPAPPEREIHSPPLETDHEPATEIPASR